MRVSSRFLVWLVAAGLLAWVATGDATAKKKKNRSGETTDPYAEYVWPPPPDEARIKLVEIISGRIDVEAPSGFRRKLFGAAPQSPYDTLRKPFGVAYDPQGRILVTDSGSAALIRFDRAESRMDVLGTKGALKLKMPLGLDVSSKGTIYVADAGLGKIVAYSPEGKLVSVYGRSGQLINPTDVALSPDGNRLFVADSKAHTIVVFEIGNEQPISTIGIGGSGDGEFAWPTSVDVDAESNLYVVDQINSRVQMFDADGNYLDQFGSLGVGFGDFVRPKDIVVDDVGFIYVTDNAFNNVQLFDIDFSLLTYIGEGGNSPGQFLGASGIAVRGDEFAVVDQIGRRLQIFRFVVPKNE